MISYEWTTRFLLWFKKTSDFQIYLCNLERNWAVQTSTLNIWKSILKCGKCCGREVDMKETIVRNPGVMARTSVTSLKCCIACLQFTVQCSVTQPAPPWRSVYPLSNLWSPYWWMEGDETHSLDQFPIQQTQKFCPSQPLPVFFVGFYGKKRFLGICDI